MVKIDKERLEILVRFRKLKLKIEIKINTKNITGSDHHCPGKRETEMYMIQICPRSGRLRRMKWDEMESPKHQANISDGTTPFSYAVSLKIK